MGNCEWRYNVSVSVTVRHRCWFNMVFISNNILKKNKNTFYSKHDFVNNNYTYGGKGFVNKIAYFVKNINY